MNSSNLRSPLAGSVDSAAVGSTDASSFSNPVQSSGVVENEGEIGLAGHNVQVSGFQHASSISSQSQSVSDFTFGSPRQRVKRDFGVEQLPATAPDARQSSRGSQELLVKTPFLPSQQLQSSQPSGSAVIQRRTLHSPTAVPAASLGSPGGALQTALSIGRDEGEYGRSQTLLSEGGGSASLRERASKSTTGERLAVAATSGKGIHLSPSAAVAHHPRERKVVIRFLFFCMFMSQIFVNYDSGAIPSVLDQISDEFAMSEVMQGVLGALPYVGLIVASPFVGQMLQRVSQKHLLLTSLGLNVLSAVLLACSFKEWILFLSRFLLGFTQSGFCIYVPVWVDEFAPEGSLTSWMGLIQGGTVLGIMVGYLVTGFFPGAGIDWRVSVAIEAGMLACLWLVFVATPAVFINLYRDRTISSSRTAAVDDAGQLVLPATLTGSTGAAAEAQQFLVTSPDHSGVAGQRASNSHVSGPFRSERVLTTCVSSGGSGEGVVVVSMAAPSDLTQQRHRESGHAAAASSTQLPRQYDTLSVLPAESTATQDTDERSGQRRDASQHQKAPPGQMVVAFARSPRKLATLQRLQTAKNAVYSHSASSRAGWSGSGETVSPGRSPWTSFRRQGSSKEASVAELDKHPQGPSKAATERPARQGSSYDNFRSSAWLTAYAVRVLSNEQPEVFGAETANTNSATMSEEVGSQKTSRAKATLGQPMTNRAPTFMAPSPAGLILETLELAARFDDPSVVAKEAGHYTRTAKSLASMSSKRRLETSGDLEGGLSLCDEKKQAFTFPVTRTDSMRMTTWQQLRALLRSPIYVWTVFTLCALLYVVTGVQYWSTKYLEQVFGVTHSIVLVAFSATAATGPTVGVLLGGLLVDWLGGYRSAKGMFRSLLLCFVCGSCACFAGVLGSFVETFPGVIACIWLLLFFGGIILPSTTGILIASVDPRYRSFASGLSMFTYNIFGYALGSFLPGLFMSVVGLREGMKLIFFWAVFGVVGVGIATFYAWHNQLAVLPVAHSSVMTVYEEDAPNAIVIRPSAGRSIETTASVGS